MNSRVSPSASIPSPEIEQAIDKLAREISEAHKDTENLVLAGIANGGVPFSEILSNRISKLREKPVHTATIDISFHRDDIGHKPITKEVEATELVHNPEDSVIVLSDDVLFSGRTVRAAMSEVHSIGRPFKIELAVLVDRGNRRLPIEANYVGLNMQTSPDEKVEVNLFPEDIGKSRIDILSA